jgi:hypothetical protein
VDPAVAQLLSIFGNFTEEEIAQRATKSSTGVKTTTTDRPTEPYRKRKRVDVDTERDGVRKRCERLCAMPREEFIQTLGAVHTELYERHNIWLHAQEGNITCRDGDNIEEISHILAMPKRGFKVKRLQLILKYIPTYWWPTERVDYSPSGQSTVMKQILRVSEPRQYFSDGEFILAMAMANFTPICHPRRKKKNLLKWAYFKAGRTYIERPGRGVTFHRIRRLVEIKDDS